ncbi:hypothetical protein DFP95_12141 [Cohnella lupini]|uniref:Uncharacterized protein n=1 Tax=Cohnella lupini TaxID=1294267 RepID=A0A3D9HZC0_9BACL|nr:hypothetical protein DFP95_12141 [Cohnella lupini]
MDRNIVEQKLDYLRELRSIEVKSSEDIKRLNERMNHQVCDSIEQDLGVDKGSWIKKDEKPTHQCIGCGFQRHYPHPNITDGIGCHKCNDSMIPIHMIPKQ